MRRLTGTGRITIALLGKEILRMDDTGIATDVPLTIFRPSIVLRPTGGPQLPI
ncbi:MAG: hypothetical protein U0V70_14400 [Terriglobia bacterium]